MLLVHVFEQCSAGDYSLAQDLSKPVVLSPLEASQRARLFTPAFPAVARAVLTRSEGRGRMLVSD